MYPARTLSRNPLVSIITRDSDGPFSDRLSSSVIGVGASTGGDVGPGTDSGGSCKLRELELGSVRKRDMVPWTYISSANVVITLAFFLLTITQQFTTDSGLLQGT